ncbi:MAG: 23S rRNA (guanosine(2251)-2'-O)-methyltransferase RlmB [Fibrobacterota bacterium]
MRHEQEENPRQIYGIHAVRELIEQNPGSVDKIYFTDKEKKGALFELMKAAKKQKLPYANIPAAKLDKMVFRGNHQGVVAYKTVRSYDPESVLEEILETEDSPLFILPASLEDPGNFGAVVRSAAAFGAHAVMVERKGSVAMNPRAAKASAGTMEHMKIVKPPNLLKTVTLLKGAGVKVFGADGKLGTDISGSNLTGPVLLITGGEHRGIPAYLQKLCDAFIAIPINSRVESLNVSAAAAILLYERSRQVKN